MAISPNLVQPKTYFGRAQKIVNFHGGQIAVTSEVVGVGSTFTVTLTIGQQVSSEVTIHLIAGQTMKKILVIEDEARTRDLLIECLEAEGFYTIGAENGLLGVQRAREQLPDLILCDIMMPQLDGYGVLSTLRTDPVTAVIPFIFVTARKTWDDLRKAMKLGADDYLTQPCTVEELLGAITTQLEKQAVQRQRFAVLAQRVPESPPTDTASIAAQQSIFPSVPQLSEVFKFIEANYHQPISLSDVAQVTGYSPGYLTELMRRQTGQTVQRWIISRRMAAARSLLLKTDQSVEQIAARVGYQNAVHFFRQFRQFYKTTPQSWRTLQRTQLSSD